MEKEILRIKLRLFRKACESWKLSSVECADIFDEYDVDSYIRDLYEIFHIQGDEANLEDIEEFLKNKGCEICR